ncbi:MAG: apolipoprotein N-acyltransferase [Aquabacterium sp.]
MLRVLSVRMAALLAVAGGGLHALSLSPWWAALAPWMPAVGQSVALVGLLRLLAGAARPGQAALVAWLYGAAWLVGATGWMYVSLHRYGGLPAWVAGGAVVLLCLALAGYMAALGWLWLRLRLGSWWCDAILFAALWLLCELARALILTGFPWGASGYVLLDTPLMALIPWVGVYGVGAIWALLVALPVFATLSARTVTKWVTLCCVVMIVGGLQSAGSGHFTRPHRSPLTVSLLQSNVPQDEKFVMERQVGMLLWHAQTLLSAPGQLVVAPETAIPLLPSQLPEGYWSQLSAGFNAPGRHALIGVPLGDFRQGYTNSVVGLSAAAGRLADGQYRYDKYHLVPFGEFIPDGFHWFVRMMNMPLGDFSRGHLGASSFSVDGQRVAPTICYEDLFGEEIARRFLQADVAPTMLANVSNLAWFGESVAIHQHLQIARMRSLEFQVPTIRATNTGATVVIDHAGAVLANLTPNTRGVLTATVQGMAGVTPFAWWAARFGLWPLVAISVSFLVWAMWMQRRAVSNGSSI